jgi:hypothetical protein
MRIPATEFPVSKAGRRVSEAGRRVAEARRRVAEAGSCVVKAGRRVGKAGRRVVKEGSGVPEAGWALLRNSGEPVPPNPPVAASGATPLSGRRLLWGAGREAYVPPAAGGREAYETAGGWPLDGAGSVVV